MKHGGVNMVGRIFSILKALWARPAVQASVWLIIESIFIWLKDWIVTFFKRNNPNQQPPSKECTPCNTKSEKQTTRRVRRPKRSMKKTTPTLAQPTRCKRKKC